MALVVQHCDDPPSVMRAGKPLALLIYLACSPRKTASREHLLNLLWADAEPERGLRTLRQTVFQLRQTLGDGAITSEDRDLSLAIDIDFDHDDFLSAIAAGDSEKAVGLYKGRFLPDFGVPGGADFEHWSDRERDRLHSAYIRSAELLIRSWLDHAQYDSAIAESRRLRDFDPERESSWRILLEALASSGDHLAAFSEAEDLERLLASDDRDPESLTRSAIARAKKARQQIKPAETSAPLLIADLTGRDREFSLLTSAWTTSKAGRFRHIHVSAPPGLGKTRLLRDVFTRLRASGARAIWIGAFAGERRLAYALASDIAGRLGQLSGASGISTAAASSLVALNPTLSSSFASSPDRTEDEEALRHRVHAMTELVEAVSEESPLALFVDDLHWSDPVSRQLLKSAFARIGESRVLLITSARTVPDSDLHLPSTETMVLNPLDREQVFALVSSFAALPEGNSTSSFISSLHEHTSGSPLLILENLHLVIERGLLRIADAHWEISDNAQLLEALSHGDALEQHLRKLEPDVFRTLLILAVAEEPKSPSIIAQAARSQPAVIEANLSALEQQGLATSSGDLWRYAHDTIAETAIRVAGPADVKAAHEALGRALLQVQPADSALLRLAIRHLEAAGRKDESSAAFARAVSLARASGDRRSNLKLAATMLGETLPSHSANRLVMSLPLSLRIPVRRPVAWTAVSMVLVAAIVIPFEMQPTKATRLSVAREPLSASWLVVPAPLIEIGDASGRRINGATDTVTVDVVDSFPGIEGTLKVAAIDGRAEFKDISVTGEGSFQLRFRAKGLQEVVARRINITGTMPTLRLTSGVVNGQQLDATHRAVTVRSGETIYGNLLLEYSSYWPSASVILGAAALWGDRTRNFVDLAPLFTPSEHQPRRTQIRFRAPEIAGTYHIVFAFDAEGNVEDFMSGTNWRLPAPIWNDGNDIADWTPAQLAQANKLGWAMSRFIKIDDATGKTVSLPHPVAATVIDVIVK
jgi:DNA-binding SARP family transcriptional activator